ncbi:MAG: radical SAM/SPASM domain-containing protein [Bacteroidetes bacterium]|nr:radical SAM/SPASM domain-containing protein [Bacteroidota bacterium]
MKLFTFPRIINYFKLLYGYLISRLLRRTLHYGMPAAVSIEPTNRCNLHCHECPGGMKKLSRDAGFMNLDQFRSIIDQLSPELAWITLYFQGEPFMNPGFFDFISYAKSRNIFVSSSTNGHFLDKDSAKATVESGLNRLIISVDGIDQQAYEAYRVGGSLLKVIEGIKTLADEKKSAGRSTPEIIIQFLVLKSNQHQIKDIRRKGIEWGGDKVGIKTAQFTDFSHGNPLMPSTEKYSRYRIQDAGWKIKNILPNHCFRMWAGCVITWDGKIVPCCFDKDAQHPFGEIKTRSFRETWNSSEYKDFRQRILNGREKIDICKNCTEGMGLSRWF